MTIKFSRCGKCKVHVTKCKCEKFPKFPLPDQPQQEIEPIGFRVLSCGNKILKTSYKIKHKSIDTYNMERKQALDDYPSYTIQDLYLSPVNADVVDAMNIVLLDTLALEKSDDLRFANGAKKYHDLLRAKLKGDK